MPSEVMSNTHASTTAGGKRSITVTTRIRRPVSPMLKAGNTISASWRTTNATAAYPIEKRTTWRRLISERNWLNPEGPSFRVLICP